MYKILLEHYKVFYVTSIGGLVGLWILVSGLMLLNIVKLQSLKITVPDVGTDPQVTAVKEALELLATGDDQMIDTELKK